MNRRACRERHRFDPGRQNGASPLEAPEKNWRSQVFSSSLASSTDSLVWPGKMIPTVEVVGHTLVWSILFGTQSIYISLDVNTRGLL